MLLFAKGSENVSLQQEEVKEILFSVFDKIGSRKKVLSIPPDISRYHSKAGEITRLVYDYYHEKLTDILPSIGTHASMTDKEIDRMFQHVPKSLFRVHRWKDDLVTLGEVPSEFISEVSEGKLNFSWPAQTNKLLVEGDYDLILSI